MSSMFPPCVVGLANALSTANLGSAAAQLLMPLTYSFLLCLSATPSIACGTAFLLPATLQVAFALAVLAFAQDFPVEVNKVSGLDKKHRNSDVWKVLGGGLGNYRGWKLGVTYGYSYGVELMIDGEHPNGVFLRVVRARNGGGGDGGILLRGGECGVEAGRRDGVGRHREEVRDEGEAVEPVGGTECWRAAWCLPREGRTTTKFDCSISFFFSMRVGSIRIFTGGKHQQKDLKRRHRFFFFDADALESASISKASASFFFISFFSSSSSSLPSFVRSTPHCPYI